MAMYKHRFIAATQTPNALSSRQCCTKLRNSAWSRPRATVNNTIAAKIMRVATVPAMLSAGIRFVASAAPT
jgi:hypothetical protein